MNMTRREEWKWSGLHWVALAGMVLGGAACSVDGVCPPGAVHVGERCLREGEAEAPSEEDASSVPDLPEDAPDAAVLGPCGDSPCAPPVPTIAGAASMAPARVLWTWSAPEAGLRSELQLDGEPVEAPAEQRFARALEPGEHTLSVRACDAEGTCSDWATHHTVVEAFGAALPRALRDSKRSIARTALGHPLALGCNGCVAPAADGASPEAAVLTLERALARGADVVQLSVAIGVPLPLARVLGRAALRASDAIVLIDIVENEPRQLGSVTPDVLAEALLDALAGAPELVGNGRPLWLRTRYESRGYLAAVHDAAQARPELGPYLRYLLRDPGAAVADFYAAVPPTPEAPFVRHYDFVDAVSLDYTLHNLPYRIERSRQAGRAVILDGVPSASGHGHALIAALRERADVILTSYRVDQARAIATAPTTDLYFGPEGMAADGSHVTLAYSRAQIAADTLDYALAAPGSTAAKPTPATSGLGDTLLPPALAFAPGVQFSVDAQLTADARVGGDLLAGFGRFGDLANRIAAFGTGRAMFYIQNGDPRVAVHTSSGFDNYGFKREDILAQCGMTLASLFDVGSSHWFVAYAESTQWTIILDGSCVLSSLSAPVPLPPGTVAQYAIMLPDGAAQSISYLRFPPGHAFDAPN